MGNDDVKYTDRRSDIFTYPEFIWFCLSEEDKSQQAAIEYWFRILDTDQDGLLSLYELEMFWEGQLQQLEAHGQAKCEFCHVINVCFDILKVPTPTVSLQYLKQRPATAARFFDYFINWHKMVERENSNGNRLHREVDEAQLSHLQTLNSMPSLGLSLARVSIIPCDNKTPWSRWADGMYDRAANLEEAQQA